MKPVVRKFLLAAPAWMSWAAQATAQAAAQADAARLASGARDVAQQAHPILVPLVHIVFIIVLVSFGGIILTTFINPRPPPP